MNIIPTRSELMNVKRRITLANSGYNLLKKKRDGLILEFYEVLKKAKTVRAEMKELYDEAVKMITLARALDSDMAIQSVALGLNAKSDVKLETKNIMGVKVPKITFEAQEIMAQGLSLSLRIDQSSLIYQRLLAQIVKVAELETTMRKLLHEIEKTKRRVNALEFVVLPRLKGIKSFIAMRLDEMERENTFRMKRIKKD